MAVLSFADWVQVVEWDPPCNHRQKTYPVIHVPLWIVSTSRAEILHLNKAKDCFEVGPFVVVVVVVVETEKIVVVAVVVVADIAVVVEAAVAIAAVAIAVAAIVVEFVFAVVGIVATMAAVVGFVAVVFAVVGIVATVIVVVGFVATVFAAAQTGALVEGRVDLEMNVDVVLVAPGDQMWCLQGYLR